MKTIKQLEQDLEELESELLIAQGKYKAVCDLLDLSRKLNTASKNTLIEVVDEMERLNDLNRQYLKTIICYEKERKNVN